MRFEESYAQAVVQELRADLTLRYIEVQSEGEPDFEVLDSAGSRIGVLEVTTLCDEALLQDTRLLYGKKKLARVPRVSCSSAWIVSIAERTNLRRLHSELDSLLGQAEDRGLRSLNWQDQAASDLYSRLRGLTGNGGAFVFDDGPYHRLAQEAAAQWETTDSVNAALVQLLKRPDDRRKLLWYGSLPERHLFVRVHLSAKQACQQLMLADVLPDSELPEHLTDLWLVPSHIHAEGTLAIWHMRAGGSWERLPLANGFMPTPRGSA